MIDMFFNTNLADYYVPGGCSDVAGSVLTPNVDNAPFSSDGYLSFSMRFKANSLVAGDRNLEIAYAYGSTASPSQSLLFPIEMGQGSKAVRSFKVYGLIKDLVAGSCNGPYYVGMYNENGIATKQAESASRRLTVTLPDSNLSVHVEDSACSAGSKPTEATPFSMPAGASMRKFYISVPSGISGTKLMIIKDATSTDGVNTVFPLNVGN